MFCEAVVEDMNKELDRKSELVLEAIYELDGEANTSEIKDYTGIQKNGIISYRYDKLEDAGLIETRTVDTGDTLPITIAELTEQGHKEVGAILEDGEPTLAERVADLRQIVVETHTKVERFEGRLDAVDVDQEDIEDVREQVISLRGDVEAVEDRMSDLEADLDGTLGTVEAKIERVEHFQDELSDVLLASGVIERSRNSDGTDGYDEGEALATLRKALREV